MSAAKRTAEWPPAVAHIKVIQRGDGSRWHYRGAPAAIIGAGLLNPEEVPGHVKCPNKGYYLGSHQEQLFTVCRIGDDVAITLLANGTTIGKLIPLAFEVE